MDFQTIDQKRRLHRFSQYLLCQRAELHPVTYSRLLKRPDRAMVRTLNKLEAALAGLVAESQVVVDPVPENRQSVGTGPAAQPPVVSGAGT